jgi:hypothetical protein
MNSNLRDLIDQAKKLGWCIAVKPRLKICILHGYAKYSFDTVVPVLESLIAKGRY